MAPDTRSRIDDPNGFLAGRTDDPASVANAGRGSDGGDDGYARDNDGNVKRNKDGSPQRKRGRKAGQRAGTATAKSKKGQDDIKGLEKILFSLHLRAATALEPEMAIDEQEAGMLAGAVKSVQDFYDVSASAEVILWVNVAGILGAVYGPRALAIMSRRKNNKKEKTKSEKSDESGPVILAGFAVPHHAPTE